MLTRGILTKERKDRWMNIADIIIEYCLYGMILFIPKSRAAIEIFACLAIFVFLIKKILNPDLKSLKSLPNLFLLLFIAFNALSLFNSGIYIKKSLISLICKWIEYGLIFLIIQDTLKNRRRIRTAVYILLIFGVIVGLDGLSQKIFGFEPLWGNPIYTKDKGLAAITGPFKHYNDFGAYLLVFTTLIAGILLSDKLEIGYRTLLTCFFALLATCLFFTYSRGSWVGFTCSIILILVLSRRIKLLIPALCIFALLLIFIPGLSERSIFKIEAQSSGYIIWYDADRFKVWGVAFRMIKESPFLGKGVGTFMNYFSKYSPMLIVQYAHNCFIQILAETGIFSFISFSGFITSVLYQGAKKFRKDNDFVLLGLIGGVFGFLIHSFFDTNLYSLQLSVLFWTCMGLISAKTRSSS